MHHHFVGFQSLSNLFHRSCSFWIHCPSHVLLADLLIFESKGRFDIRPEKKWSHLVERKNTIGSLLAILPHTSSSLHLKTVPQSQGAADMHKSRSSPKCHVDSLKLLPWYAQAQSRWLEAHDTQDTGDCNHLDETTTLDEDGYGYRDMLKDHRHWYIYIYIW